MSKSYARSGLLAKAFAVTELAGKKIGYPGGSRYYYGSKRLRFPKDLSTVDQAFDLKFQSTAELDSFLLELKKTFPKATNVVVKLTIEATGKFTRPTTPDEQQALRDKHQRDLDDRLRRSRAIAKARRDATARKFEREQDEKLTSVAQALKVLRKEGLEVVMVKEKKK